MKITVEKIMAWNPCNQHDSVYGYPEERVRQLVGRGVTLLQALDGGIPAIDIVWLFTPTGGVNHAAATCLARAGVDPVLAA